MTAPQAFADWLSGNTQVDVWGNAYRYHPRSDSHSVALCHLVLADLLAATPMLRAHAAAGHVAYGINVRFRWEDSGKGKTIDLAVGQPTSGPSAAPEDSVAEIGRTYSLSDVRISLEAKSCMTEHIKSKPRLFDELSSSHEIVHRGSDRAIACGITVVNIANRFASPLRQHGPGITDITPHRQPDVAQAMVEHLRGLTIRDGPGDRGFDAYATFLVDCDNLSDARLYPQPPAPQPGDQDHYDGFLARISRFYADRWA